MKFSERCLVGLSHNFTFLQGRHTIFTYPLSNQETISEFIMKIGIYLTFDGNCAEAFDFYKSVFGGNFSWNATHSTLPEAVRAKNTKNDPNLDKKILHISLPIGSGDEKCPKFDLMGSDYIPSMCSHAFNKSSASNTQICICPQNTKEADRLFKSLVADGGVVESPLQDMYWGSYHGALTDRFGVRWMIDCETEKPSCDHKTCDGKELDTN